MANIIILHPKYEFTRLWPADYVETIVGDVYQLFPEYENDYLYMATSRGLRIVQVSTERIYMTADYLAGFTSIWVNETTIYCGTTESGIYAFDKNDIGTGAKTAHLYQYKNAPDITANHVTYLHGNGDYLCCTTISGIDFTYISLDETISSFKTDLNKCFVCANSNIYFTSSGVPNTLSRANTPMLFETPIIYTCGSGYFDNILNIYDFYVTEGTSAFSSGWNTLFIATSGSAFIFDDGTKEYDKYTLIGS